mmetsp:Transcript_12301/g.34553  ORF Transcript_12301/g.34553 Transcript_12301/m.34553 type:complete len:767 (-) Transcript_12301:350-2650(-)
MDDPFASLTSGYIHKPSMKDAKKQQQQAKAPVRPPVWHQQQSPGGSLNGSPVHRASSPVQNAQPSGNRYPSPSSKKTSMEGAQPIKHAGSTGSLDTLSNLSWNSSSPNQASSMGGAMRMSTSGSGLVDSGASSKVPATSAVGAPTAPAAVSADDFDKMFGSVDGKPDSGTVGVDVFGGDFPPPSSSDPFDVFGDIGGSAISHTQPISPPLAADELIPGFGGETAAPLPASPPPPYPEESANNSSFTDLTNDEAGSGSPPPSYHSATIQAAPSQSASSYEPPAPPSYTDVTATASPPPKAGGTVRSAASAASSAAFDESPQHDAYQEAMHQARMPQHSPSGTGELSRKDSTERKAQGGSSLFGKLSKEGNKIGGLLMKHGAKAANQATKAVKQGMNQVREIVNDNLHGASGTWTFNDDGMLEATGASASTSAVHIQMADTLLGVDPATRGAMLGAMEPADREAVEAILSGLVAKREKEGTPLPGSPAERQPPPRTEAPAAVAVPNAEEREPPSPPPALDSPGVQVAASGAPVTAQPPSPQLAAPEESPPAEDTVDFLFSDPPPSSNTAPAAPTPTGLEDLFTTAPSAASSNPDSMFDNIFGDDAAKAELVEVSGRLCVIVDSHISDSAERAELRKGRAKRVQDRIDQQLKEKLERDRTEQEQRDEQAHLKSQIQDSLKAWKKNSHGNVVALLSSLHTVLWEGSGWQPIGMGDLLSDAGVKKGWRKANLLVHPDKVKQKGGDMATLVRADMIFDTLKEAYAHYKPMGC